jgi:hypothetical protein
MRALHSLEISGTNYTVTQPIPQMKQMLLESRLFIFRLLNLNISVSAIFYLSKKETLTY